MTYWYLAIAIVAEVAGTIALKASTRLTEGTATTIVVIAYGTAFYFLPLVLKTLTVGVVYALVWASFL